MSAPLSIAIDGPAASGKTTLAKSLAKELDYLYFDTGVLYRAMTLAVLKTATDEDNEDAVTQLAEEITIDVDPVRGSAEQAIRVLLDGEDVTAELRSPQVEASVSVISAYAGVRQALKAQQRRIGLRGGVVMVGRDIGTVVLPEADLKIYLDASVEERARRRFLESEQAGGQLSYAEVEDSIRQRDKLDAQRAVAPLRPADDAVVIESDGLQADEVLYRARELTQAKLGAP